ncbi:HNH endonuclease signature motif containing protein [Streptosporangium sp. NPDC051022]|uniref:HNH endonuclease signature motif containing protein n=1 Tax=Streptosporangium sp. NPDC051022 TaxID=3155752 RepID=UPI0034444905
MSRRRLAGARWLAQVNMHGPVPELRPELGPCWLWTGDTNDQGYGYIIIGGKKISVARYVYERAHGPLPDGYEPDHMCHDPSVCPPGPACPHRTCCNIAHLEGVTHRENVLRSGAPTAINAAKETCIHGHPLTFAPVVVDGVSYPGGTIYVPPRRTSHRYCLICKTRAAEGETRLRREVARLLVETAGGMGEQLTIG